MPEAKCCGLCGRWGTRGYREADSSERPGYNPARAGRWVCVNDRACKQRQNRFLRVLDRVASRNAAESA